jgi:hypothetical protein
MDNIIEILLKIKDKNDLYLSLLNELVDSSMSLNCHLYKKGIPLAISNTIEKYQEIHNIITHHKMIHKLKELNQKINDELIEYCQHVYTIDYIDIDPDNSHKIYYCSKCHCTFKDLRTLP